MHSSHVVGVLRVCAGLAVAASATIARATPPAGTGFDPAHLHHTVSASIDAGLAAKARAICEQYLGDVALGPDADAVDFLLGSMAVQANDPRRVDARFGRLLAGDRPVGYEEEMLFLLGNARFSLGEYDQARETYARYRSEFPRGGHVEEAGYRLALCAVFSGDYERAVGLLDDYIAAHPAGIFVPDAKYRLAVCLFAAERNDEVIAACQAWEKQYPQGQMLGEVLALRADALAAKNQSGDAVDVYLRAAQAATTAEVADYSIFAAQKLLQKAGDWPRLGAILKDYLQAHPDRPSAVMAAYWIVEADLHEGRNEEAKTFVSDAISTHIGDKQRDGVEQLLTQLAALCLRPRLASGSAATGASGPAAGDVSPALDPGAELERALGGALKDTSALTRARVLFARSELARLRHQTPAQQAALESITRGFKPAELDAPLLAAVGDYLLGKSRTAESTPYFECLLKNYPGSVYAEFAYNGLGQAALAAGDYNLALQRFTDAVEKAGATARLKEVTLGKARALLALGRLDDATTAFEQVAANREWRGEATAEAIYYLGDIRRQQGKLPEAIVYYQRVFVAYQKFLPWIAKAYVASAECFSQLGKNQEAVKTYQEMLRNPKLQDLRETQMARNFLQKNGRG